MGKLMTKAGFAQLCGVNQSSITKGIAGRLAPALVGDRIDAEHPAAVAYYHDRVAATRPSPVEGIDPLYAEALDHCRASGRWSAKSLRARFGIGSERAALIVKQLTAAGVVPEAPVVRFDSEGKIHTPAPPPDTPHRTPAHRRPAPLTPPDTQPEPPAIPSNIEAFADMTLRELIARFGTDVRLVDWLKATKEIEMINERRIKNAAAQGKLIARDLVERGVIDPFNSAHLRLMTDGAKTIAAASVAKHQAGADGPEIERYVSEVIGSFLRPVKNKVAQALRTAATTPPPGELWEN